MYDSSYEDFFLVCDTISKEKFVTLVVKALIEIIVNVEIINNKII